MEIDQEPRALPEIAYLSSGRVYLCSKNGRPREFVSPFLQKVSDNRAKDRERLHWQTGSASWNLWRGPTLGASPFPHAQDADQIAVITALTTTSDGFCYAAFVGSTGAVLRIQADDLYEHRVMHRQGFTTRSLAYHPTENSLAFSALNEEGASHIAILSSEAGKTQIVTDGDVVDDAPAWDPREKHTIVYHSAGIGRTSDGSFYGLGPASLLRLEIENGRLSTLIEDEKYDYLSPRIGHDGSVYCLRRPWELHQRPSLKQLAIDTVLFPYRLGRTGVYLVHALSLLLVNKPVINPQSDLRNRPNRTLVLWGRVIDAQRELAKSKDGTTIVPSGWELVRVRDGEAEALHDHVAAFDVTQNGSIVWTNGTKIWRDSPGGTRKLIATASMVESIAASE